MIMPSTIGYSILGCSCQLCMGTFIIAKSHSVEVNWATDSVWCDKSHAHWDTEIDTLVAEARTVAQTMMKLLIVLRNSQEVIN